MTVPPFVLPTVSEVRVSPHGNQLRPTRADLPPIIAHRYECPSCGAVGGEPCRLSPRFTQEYSHEARHQAARRADWRQLCREIAAGHGPISSLTFAR